VATASGSDGAGNPFPLGVMTPALQVNGTATTVNTTVSGTTTTDVLSVSGTGTVGGTLTANTQVLVNATGSAALEVGGNAHVTSTLQVDSAINGGTSIAAVGQVLAGNASGSATLEVNGNGHVTGGLQVDGTLTLSGGSVPQSPPSNAGSFTLGTLNPGTSNLVAWAASVTDVLNEVIAQLVLAGVLS
jgi:hypothetical protein